MTATTENYSIIETHQLEVFTIDVWENNIFHVQVKGDIEVELKHVKEQHEFFKQRFDQKNKFLILVESGYHCALTKEAREFSALPETNIMKAATAVVITSLAERLITNFIINFTSEQEIQIQLFDCREKAVKWLLSFQEPRAEVNSKPDLTAAFNANLNNLN